MIDVTNDKLLTQGTIFNCAYNSSYPDDETLGLIITARCDISNKDKVSFYNYIPAIPFNIWKEKELLPVLKKKTYKDLRSKYLTLLREGGFSESNLKTYGYERIIDIIKNKASLPKCKLQSLQTQHEKIECFEKKQPYAKLLSYFNKEIEKCLTDIIENKNADYFFIDYITGYGPAIVNLREIYELNISTALKIPDGIELNIEKTYPGLNTSIENQFCSIVGHLRSPFIELLMQRFSNNFVRIGVDNHDHKLLTNIMEK
ncbi:hypothetical protein HCW92_22695 [Escherichia coli]|nr:hypothetical protein [Escherichia coli]